MSKTLLLFLLFPLLAKAQWHQQSFNLRPGWNAIYPFVDASHQTLEQLLKNQPEIVEIWQWQPERTDLLPVDASAPPLTGTEWALWRRNESNDTTFNNLRANTAYLFKVSDNATALRFTLTGKPVSPKVTWRRDGNNLVGFPVKAGASGSFNSYLRHADALSLTNIDPLRYRPGALANGPTDADRNPGPISAGFSDINRGEAYWVRTRQFSTYYGALQIGDLANEVLDFGTDNTNFPVRFINHSDQPLDVTLENAPSALTPGGQVAHVGPVPLQARPANRDNPQGLGSPLTFTIPADSELMVDFSINRLALNGPTGQPFASLVRITTENQEMVLGTRAEKTPLAGLWLGTATINQVASVRKRFARDSAGNTIYQDRQITDANGNTLTVPGEPELVEDLTTPQSSNTLPGTSRAYPLRLLVHVDVNGQATLISHVYQGLISTPSGGTEVGLTLREGALDPGNLARARRLSVAHLPLNTNAGLSGFGPGIEAAATISLAHDAAENPFVHAYHPDHDNLDSRFQNALPAGRESYHITRSMKLNFDSSAPDGSGLSWGSTVLTGTFTEDITGTHKDTLRTAGPFALQKIDPTPALTP